MHVNILLHSIVPYSAQLTHWSSLNTDYDERLLADLHL